MACLTKMFHDIASGSHGIGVFNCNGVYPGKSDILQCTFSLDRFWSALQQSAMLGIMWLTEMHWFFSQVTFFLVTIT